MKRCVFAAVAVAVAALGMVACGGSSGAATRIVKGCEIKPATHCVGADLAGTNLFAARMPRADLHRADLHGANLRGANLARADLRDAKLEGADLRGARLTGAKLNGANLSLAKLGGANLRNADLHGASLIGANLTGAKVTRAELRGAKLCRTIGANGVADNSGCKAATGRTGSSTTTTTAKVPTAPLPPLAVVRFTAPSTYSCGGGGGGSSSATGGTKRRQPNNGGGGGGEGMATISWSVPQAAQAIFTFDGVRPSSDLTNLPAIVTNPAGQPAGDVTDGTVTIAFTCDRKPHVILFVWTQANALGVAVPGAPAATRSAALAYAG